MTADETLGRIDDALEAWENGPDAMRWEPDAEPGMSGPGYDPDRGALSATITEPCVYWLPEVSGIQPTQAELAAGRDLTGSVAHVSVEWSDPSPRSNRFMAAGRAAGSMAPLALPFSRTFQLAMQAEIEEFQAAIRAAIDRVVQASIEFGEIVREIERDTGKSWVYLIDRANVPKASAERTNSLRRRAGSRRTKRLARLRRRGER